jgi:hypothetical protein
LLSDNFPHLRPAVRELHDLTTKVENCRVRTVGGGDKLAEDAARDEGARGKLGRG